MRRALLAALMAGLVAGCSWFGAKDNALPPSPLPQFKPTVSVQHVWSADAGSGIDDRFLELGPAVVDGKVYAADRKGRVYAFAAHSGKRLWETDTKTALSGGVGTGDGLVLVGARDGRVIALAGTDGRVKWRHQVSSEVLSRPRAAGGVVVVQSSDGNIYGLDAANGHQLWAVNRSVPVLTLRGSSSPVLVQGVALCGLASGKLDAIRVRDGTVLWEATVALPHGSSELARMVDVDSDPVVEQDTVYAAAYQGRVQGISLASGQTVWEREVGSYAGIGVDLTRVFVTDDESRIWALDRYSGATLWRQNKLARRGLTAPIPFNGRYLVVGDQEGYLHWLDRSDGHFVARVRLDSSGILSAPVVSGDTLYALSRDGELAAYRVHTGG